MAVFTSAYKALAHGALNWDTQLDQDMSTLETILQQNSWTPSLGGTAATVGANAVLNGYWTRLGQKVTYNGRIVFGSSASFGTGQPAVLGLNSSGNIDQTVTSGTGILLRAAGGNPLAAFLAPSTGSSCTIWAMSTTTTGGLTLPQTAWGTPAQSDQFVFAIHGVLA